jgi:cytochrome c-type biogenesis protein CcmE
MDRDRKRKIRLVVALTVAVLLAVALVYTSFTAGTEAKEPGEVLAGSSVGETNQVTGQVIADKGEARGREFVIADEDGGGERMTVLYPEGIVPDPFRVGRDVVVTGQLDESGSFEAEKDSLITKCPSKFSDEVEDPTNVEFVN